MEAVIFYLIAMAVIIFNVYKKKNAQGKGRKDGAQSARRRPARSTDGHVLRGKKDITCRQFGHNHPEDDMPRFIVHDDPEDGFIILNGVKMRISEADRYENSI